MSFALAARRNRQANSLTTKDGKCWRLFYRVIYSDHCEFSLFASMTSMYVLLAKECYSVALSSAKPIADNFVCGIHLDNFHVVGRKL